MSQRDLGFHLESRPCPECGATMLYDKGEPWDGPTWGCTGCGHSANATTPPEPADALAEARAQIENLRAKTALANIEIATIEKELVPIADVITSFVAVIKPVSDLLSDLPDIIERKTGAAPDVISAVSKEIDAHRIVMFEKLDAVLNRSLDTNELTVDDGVTDEPKPVKKTRKVKDV